MIENLSPQAQRLIRDEMHDEESILWCEEPDTDPSRAESIFGVVANVFISLIGIMFISVAALVLWFKDDYLGNQLTLVVMGLVGLAAFILPWLPDRNREPTVYLLTGERAVIFDGEVYSYDRKQLKHAVLELNADGSGNVILEQVDTPDSDSRHSDSSGGSPL